MIAEGSLFAEGSFPAEGSFMLAVTLPKCIQCERESVREEEQRIHGITLNNFTALVLGERIGTPTK